MKLNAKPHNNGNSPAHFRQAARKILAAQEALMPAISALRCDVLHRRNYQHLDAPLGAHAQQKDIEAMRPLLDALALTGDLIDALTAATK